MTLAQAGVVGGVSFDGMVSVALDVWIGLSEDGSTNRGLMGTIEFSTTCGGIIKFSGSVDAAIAGVVCGGVIFALSTSIEVSRAVFIWSLMVLRFREFHAMRRQFSLAFRAVGRVQIKLE